VHAALALEPDGALPAGGRLSCPRAFVGAFRGDYYDALVAYRGLLDRQGYRPQPWSRRAYEPGWSSWGYRTDLTPARLRAVIPKLKALGLARVTIDEGWFGTYGDWQPRSQRFGAESIRDLVRELHRNGLSVDIYWVPLGVELGQLRHDGTHFGFAEVATAHPDWLILDAFGQPAGFVRRLAALCPALPEVQEYHRQLVRRFLGAWACDGQKLDNAFTVPACHNPKHHHRSPEDSVRAMGAVYRAVYETAREARPDGVTQICPCGTLPNLAWLPYMDQPIVADPWTSAQVRQRITVYKALFGADAPVSGDHVEMTGRRNTAQGLRMLGLDFASTIAVGGVPATRFVWPEEREETQDVFLTPEKELRWRRWLRLYWARRLAEGRFRHLYVHGVDAPEAYVVEKDGVMHYAFFAPERGVSWRHPVELRGLAPRPYRLRDYVAERELGVVRGPVATLAVGFEDALLIEARPQ
jgi:alpha-galactosidase